jgi:hypothetical protein
MTYVTCTERLHQPVQAPKSEGSCSELVMALAVKDTCAPVLNLSQSETRDWRRAEVGAEIERQMMGMCLFKALMSLLCNGSIQLLKSITILPQST